MAKILGNMTAEVQALYDAEAEKHSWLKDTTFLAFYFVVTIILCNFAAICLWEGPTDKMLNSKNIYNT